MPHATSKSNFTTRALAAAAAAGLLLAGPLATPAQAQAAKGGGVQEAVEKPIRTLINAVRYSKDEMGLKQLDGEAQGRFLLEGEWDKATPAQREEFVQLFHRLFGAIAFPKIRDNFKHLETILYEAPAVEGDTARTRSTLVILHPLKKQEIKAEYELRKTKAGWKVVDVTVLGTGGNSMLTDIRKEQVGPLYAQGGMDHLLGLMRQRAAQLEAAAKQASK